jgi:enoyl-CoA hydratase/carnithine racemase
MCAWQTLKLEEPDRGVTMLTLDRAPRRNAINQELGKELLDCLQGLQRRKDVRVLIVTGAGNCFCSGGDLTERVLHGPAEASAQRALALAAMDLLDGFPCPVIAMVNGAALAGGLELALACDIRIAADVAVLGLPEVRASGGFPGGGGPTRLERLVGRGRASLLVFSGRQVTAAEAFALGMVEMVVPAQRLAEETMALARQIASASPTGVRAAKQLIRRSADLDFNAAMKLSRELREPLDASPDFQEAMTAWQERRAPNFAEVQ